jgi:uncharacterized membrane protein SirB2
MVEVDVMNLRVNPALEKHALTKIIAHIADTAIIVGQLSELFAVLPAPITFMSPWMKKSCS